MTNHVSPAHVLRAVDVLLLDFLNVTLGGIEAAKRSVPELNRTELPGGVLATFISNYDQLVERDAATGDGILRHAQLIYPLTQMSTTDRCNRIQLRAALALLDAAGTPGHAERVEVSACRAEIEGELHGADRANPGIISARSTVT